MLRFTNDPERLFYTNINITVVITKVVLYDAYFRIVKQKQWEGVFINTKNETELYGNIKKITILVGFV